MEKKPMCVENTFHIKAYEIDAMGIVSNIVYVKWFEDLRHLLLDKYYPYQDMMEEKKSPILMKTEVEYKKPLTIMDTVYGKAWFSNLGHTKWEITLEIGTKDTLHCRGKQTGGFYSIEKNRPIAFPKWFVDVYTECQKGNDLYHPTESDFDEIINVWEASVRATHTFLKEEDISFFKEIGRNQALYSVDLVCIKDCTNRIVAFMGIDGTHLEMLFIHPDQRGKGLGKFLVNYAIEKKRVNTVDVNEQNEQAVGFYLHLGFEVTLRDAVDGTGKPFPILHLQLKSN
ncbi:GNAT family N-acetyltransferase [Bacteroides sp. 519]|uniref:GNAT family N-acetyltransferase n=1 Tax=Bacteroides sp. 519 TaxID=2302937 RepID=UPI0013D7B620|nr:GNAT family N-acetyltransferase [Bacteroides sp. 519]NDV59822.1 GNAT family N-acetyltransferase [Bacteroides sp. 519]